MRYFTLVLLILCSSLVHAMEIRYQLHMTKPQNHYFEVEMLISKNNQKTIDLKLPVWAPGSYLVREFSKNINLVKAFDEKGNRVGYGKGYYDRFLAAFQNKVTSIACLPSNDFMFDALPHDDLDQKINVII